MRVAGGATVRPQNRVLGYAMALLGSCAVLAFLLSFFAAGPFTLLAQTPMAVRIGVIALIFGFMALAFEESRRNDATSARRFENAVVETSLDNRLNVVESLLEASNQAKSPLGVDEILRVLLDAAVTVAGAQSGNLDFFEDRGGDLAVARTVSTDPRKSAARPPLPTLEIPLSVEERLVGLLTLYLPKSSPHLDETTLHSLERFSGKAARIVESANALNRTRASEAYLEASNLVKSRFLTTISHELRTPLTSIIGYSKTLDNHWSRLENDQKREFVREIEKQGNRMCRLVERILEAARVELQGVIIEPIAHDVRTTVQKALAPFMATDADRLQVALPERPIEAELDPFVIDQVLSNLVDNALRYTKGSVRISLDAYRSSVTISVSDNGEGIDPKQLNLVLEPLYRIDENVQSGTGLGLHIVRTLVESHGGRGEIRSGSTGTHIAVKLPRTASSRISGKVVDPSSRSLRAI